MTPEQLDEIEKLAEAATPGLWVAEQDAALIAAMRKYALPLVKALREAREALEQVSSDDRMSEAQILATIRHAQAQKDEAIRQRDDARAEVEQLRIERDEARKWLEGICVEFESTIAHEEWRAAGSKGMSVPFFGDFADAARHPGMIGRMGWWARQFRAALKEGDR